MKSIKLAKLKYNKQFFIEKARKVHGNKYILKYVDYKNIYKKVLIKCRKHGLFLIAPHHFLTGRRCRKCSNEFLRKKFSDTRTDFIFKAKRVHKNKYSYKYVRYINSLNKVKIRCHLHGDFKQSPASHLRSKYGCPKCQKLSAINKTKIYTNEHLKSIINSELKKEGVIGLKTEFLKKKYPKIHKRVNTSDYKTLDNLCKSCLSMDDYSLYKSINGIKNTREMLFFLLLKECVKNKVIYQFKIKNTNSKIQYIDFYFPDIKLAIEINGLQHYRKLKSKFFNFAAIKERDKIKRKTCKRNKITLLEIPNYLQKDLKSYFIYCYSILTKTHNLRVRKIDGKNQLETLFKRVCKKYKGILSQVENQRRLG